MGLFSNNKKLCPICGAPTPRLLATKVEDIPLCKDCAGKIDMQDGLDSSMTLDAFKKYIACYDENQPLREKFHETYRHSFAHEVSYLTVHSVLHLLGYDHVDEGEDKRRMRAREKEIMRLLDV